MAHNCKEHDVTFELESSYVFDLDLQCRLGMQVIPTLVLQRHVRCMYGSAFALLNRTISLSSRWGLIAAKEAWDHCDTFQNILASVEILGVSPTKATLGIPSNITLTIHTNAASTITRYECLWGAIFRTKSHNHANNNGSTTTPRSVNWTTFMVTCETPTTDNNYMAQATATNMESMTLDILATDNQNKELVTDSGLKIMFENPATVQSASPSAAPAAAAVTVTVTGAGFRNTAALSCRVGRGASGVS